ncbi:MAG: hypothetical protein IIB38_11050 [Candidatus Hydrogenedentes bacterium]|nr:hypothetical protein [Candidatus Hydrogenedentota bacterium]
MKNARVSTCLTLMLAGAFWLAGVSQTACAASISGTIRYDGDRIPTMKPIDMSKEEKCHTYYGEPPVGETIVIGEDKTFENVFVRVVGGLPDMEYPVPDEPVVLNQEGCRFRPHVIGVQANQILKILNSDGILHNVNAKPKMMRPFNKAMPPTMKEIEHTFKRAEFPFRIKCDVHAWMSGYIGVLNHPFFSVTGKGGAYEISGLDAGTYEIEVWQEFWAEKFGAMKFTVTLGDGESKVVDIVYPYGEQAQARPQ